MEFSVVSLRERDYWYTRKMSVETRTTRNVSAHPTPPHPRFINLLQDKRDLAEESSFLQGQRANRTLRMLDARPLNYISSPWVSVNVTLAAM